MAQQQTTESERYVYVIKGHGVEYVGYLYYREVDYWTSRGYTVTRK